MREGRLSVIQPLTLVSVRRFGSRLRLAVRTQTRELHRISFRFESEDHARIHRVSMLRWIADRTALAYVKGANECVLLEIETLLGRAFA